MRHLLTMSDLCATEIESIFAITGDLKAKWSSGLREPLLPGRMMALLFEKPSLRTRVSFESGMTHLGGGSLFLGDDVGFGTRESTADFSRVLSQYVDVAVLRAKHQTVLNFAEYATCHVINGLTEVEHPCQALADLYTLRERFGSLRGRRIAWVGDGNNVARSLALACAMLDIEFAAAIPAGYGDDLAKDIQGGESFPIGADPQAAVQDAIAVYTDVWVSMGQEAEKEQRLKDLAPFQVNGELMAAAPQNAVFMHCLPARRGYEVTDEVIDGPQSVVVEQAANRMHLQKGILAWMLGAKSGV